ncbi:MAG: zinc dependent phospholipase C family protein [Eubacteriales bacterium]|nr:zinc dependent phospholipase C family protein [Eubacteriales bacterium]
MANWITHCTIADLVLQSLPQLSRRGFAVGSIMPDCNLENEDWSTFTPPREVTHYMRGEKKTSADAEAFLAEHFSGRRFAGEEERSFLLGYYAHLMADRLFMLFLRDEARLEQCFARLLRSPEHAAALAGHALSFDMLKQVFGRPTVFADILYFEQEYTRAHPQSCYCAILRPLRSFPDYLPHFPPDAVARKVRVMIPEAEPDLPRPSLLFFTQEEYEGYLRETTGQIVRGIRQNIAV